MIIVKQLPYCAGNYRSYDSSSSQSNQQESAYPPAMAAIATKAKPLTQLVMCLD